MKWNDWSKAVAGEEPIREGLANRALSNLKDKAPDHQGKKFAFESGGNTLVVAYQEGKSIRVWDCEIKRVADLDVLPSDQRPELTAQQQKAAEHVRFAASSVDPEHIRPHIRPLDKHDNDTVKVTRAFGMVVWNMREAFVQLFASDPNFNADLFRKECEPK